VHKGLGADFGDLKIFLTGVSEIKENISLSYSLKHSTGKAPADDAAGQALKTTTQCGCSQVPLGEFGIR
jgi:hypothetical protein